MEILIGIDRPLAIYVKKKLKCILLYVQLNKSKIHCN